MHKKMAEALDKAMDKIKAIQKDARENGNTERPKWPMIVLRTPKGWTGPKVVAEIRLKIHSEHIRYLS